MPQFKNLSADQVKAAFQTVLGRDASAQDLQNFTEQNRWFRNTDDLKRGLAISGEGQKKKVDVSKYGEQFIDSSAGLDTKRTDVWNALKEVKGKNYRITKTDLDSWAGGSLAQLRASKDAKEVALQGGTAMVYGDKSLKSLMDKQGLVDDANFKAGDFFLVPTGTALKGRLKIVGTGDKLGDEYKGYDIVRKEERSRSGIVGSTAKMAGLGDKMANKLDSTFGKAVVPALGAAALINPAAALTGALSSDEIAAIGGGTRGAAARSKQLSGLAKQTGVAKAFKTNPDVFVDRADQVGDVVTSIGAGVADAVAFGGLPVASTVNTLTNAAEAESLAQDPNWGKMVQNLAIDWAIAGTGYGLAKKLTAARATLGVSTSVSQARNIGIANTAFRTTSGFASAKLKGASTDDALRASAQALVTSFVPGDWGGGSIRALTAGALTYVEAQGKDKTGFQTSLEAAAAMGSSYAYTKTNGNKAGAWDQMMSDVGLGKYSYEKAAEINQFDQSLQEEIQFNKFSRPSLSGRAAYDSVANPVGVRGLGSSRWSPVKTNRSSNGG